MYYDPGGFPFVETLQRNWRVVRDELLRLDPRFVRPWSDRVLCDQGWDVYGLFAFGSRPLANCERCPETTRLVEAIPGMMTAGFSILQPNTHIRPHVGYLDSVLRCHLGLLTPTGCAMRVGSEVRTWGEGECLIFDDTVEHEVWHKGESPRAVLLIDFAKPRTDARPAA
jgi:beta-hydroxylase